MFVYLLTCLVTGKVYVGKTSRGIAQRWSEHVFNAAHNHRSYISKAIRKYGVGSFVVEVLCEADSEQMLSFYERVFIAALKANESQWGYNLTSGGEGTLGRKMSAEQRQQLSESRKGKKLDRPQWNTGKKLSAEHCATLSKILRDSPRKPWLGKKLSAAHRAAIGRKGRKQSATHVENKRLALIGNPKCNTWQGKHHSEETKTKCSAVKKLWWAQRKLLKGKTP